MTLLTERFFFFFLMAGSKWGCQQSYDIANGALAECQKLRTGKKKKYALGTMLSS
jgi:hypothetical protein